MSMSLTAVFFFTFAFPYNRASTVISLYHTYMDLPVQRAYLVCSIHRRRRLLEKLQSLHLCNLVQK